MVVVFSNNENGHVQITFATFLSLSNQLGHVGHALTGAALGRLGHFQRGQAGRDIDAEVGRLDGVERLLLGLHDVGQRGVARLVQAQVGGDHRRQLDRHGLEATVDFTRHRGLAIGKGDLRSEGRLRPARQRSQHLAGLVGIVVDGLLAADHQIRLFLVAHGLEQLGHGQRLQLDVGLDQDGAVGADRQRRTQRLLAGTHAAAHRHDFGHHPGFLQTHRFFHRDLVEGVHAHLDVGQIHAAAIGLDANLHVVIDNAFDGYQNLHESSSLLLAPTGASMACCFAMHVDAHGVELLDPGPAFVISRSAGTGCIGPGSRPLPKLCDLQSEGVERAAGCPCLQKVAPTARAKKSRSFAKLYRPPQIGVQEASTKNRFFTSACKATIARRRPSMKSES